MGQYTQQDPIGLAGENPTLYAYVHDPNGWIDPFGLIIFPRWNLGDPIDKIMRNGSNPSWDVVRSRYWKNRADAIIREGIPGYNADQISRMRSGRALLGANGAPMEIHHNIPQRSGATNINNPANLREVTPQQHAALDPHRKLASNNGTNATTNNNAAPCK